MEEHERWTRVTQDGNKVSHADIYPYHWRVEIHFMDGGAHWQFRSVEAAREYLRGWGWVRRSAWD